MTNHTQAAHRRRTRPRPRRTAALAALAVAQFMVVLDSSIVNVALPTIRSEPGLTAAQSSWVLDGYLVAFGGLLLLGGVLRRRAVFLAGLSLFTTASAACTLAPVARSSSAHGRRRGSEPR